MPQREKAHQVWKFLLILLMPLIVGIALIASAEDGTPPPPRDLSAEAGDGQVVLTWERPDGVGPNASLGYWLYLYPSFGDFTLGPPDTNTSYWDQVAFIGNGTSFTLDGLENGIRYYIHLRSVNGTGEGDPSDIVMAMPLGYPSEPRNLTGVPFDDAVLLDWEPPREMGDLRIYHYRVFRGGTPYEMEEIAVLSNKWMDWDLYRPPPTDYTDGDIVVGRAYYYNVVAVNRLGNGTSSVTIKVGEDGVEHAVPSIPRDTRAYVQDGHVKLFWHPPGYNGDKEVLKYRIYRWTEGEEARGIGEVPSDQLSFIDVLAEAGVEYHYGISAINSVGEGPRGLEVTAFIQPSAADYPDADTSGNADAGPTSTSRYLTPVLVIAAVIITTLVALHLLRDAHDGRGP